MDAQSVQLSELEMLKSMYPGELRISADLERDFQKACCDPQLAMGLPPMHYSVHLNLENKGKVEITVELSCDYPVVEPEIFVRSDALCREQQALLNRELADFIASLERGEVCVYSAITWCQDNTERFILQENPSKPPPKEKNQLIRLWLYSHHIYSTTKRKTILDLGNQMNCTGFFLPGRPGIICMEGSETDVMDMWYEIKSMNWKKLTMRNKEEIDKCAFTTFAEVIFEKPSESMERHMDMGQFFKYLAGHNLGYMFKEYFGVDGQSGQADIIE